MKILFLDFDGVLNSKQEVIYHHRFTKKPTRNAKSFLAFVFAKAVQWAIKGWMKLPAESRRYRAYREWQNFYILRLSDHCTFCPIACSNVQWLLDKDPELMIVISSTWRVHGMRHCLAVLKLNGIDTARVIGRTGGWEDGGKQRGDQIKGWLERRAHAVKTVNHGMTPYKGNVYNDASDWSGVDTGKIESITHFAVLDDDSDMDAVKDHFVKTDGHLGVTLRDAYQVLRILGTPYNRVETLFDVSNPFEESK